VSKAIGVSLAALATKVMIGRKMRELGFTREIMPKHVAVKEVVRFPGVDTVLGPR
jgi:carbamoyl-phosphate synthase large subunit